YIMARLVLFFMLGYMLMICEVVMATQKDNKAALQELHFNNFTIITGLSSNHVNEFHVFLENKQQYQPDNQLIVYNLGLTTTEVSEIQKRCDGCKIRDFYFQKYPPHVKNLRTFAFKILIIDETLREFQQILWSDTSTLFTTKNLVPIVDQVKSSGVLAASINGHLSNSYTHPGMFKYFNVTRDSYNKQISIEANKILIINSARIQTQFMRPLVRCALDLQCINPTGAVMRNSTWSQIFYRVIYNVDTYVHRQDQSAFNIVLGKMFNMSLSKYCAKEGAHIYIFPEGPIVTIRLSEQSSHWEFYALPFIILFVLIVVKLKCKSVVKKSVAFLCPCRGF
ncbi:unnamed protein product, partial [Owenia fusiformis]